ncbi:glycosyltransferase family 2 protein [Paenibacillus silvisoli]|uniref:glycosyltransferase family 2 protein n=1 Tax=Paenibacillus silvisoli TaxID=3110539 RepID=UPI00280573B7|nr:glycosyltransferase family 2 protein [Paenibacillus silvisoli]
MHDFIGKLLLLIPSFLREYLLLVTSIRNPLRSVKKITNIKKLSNTLHKSEWGSLDNDIDIWKNAFINLSLRTTTGIEIANCFFNNDLTMKKAAGRNNDLIVVCVVKDDLVRIKSFYQHYRSLGVQKFAILDNSSTDGTYEWLLEQDDTDVFHTTTPYSTNRRQGWINRLISYYGFNRWYLIVDADEHLMFEGMESKSISDFKEHAWRKGNFRVRTLTVDMYSKHSLNEKVPDNDYVSSYIYFDSDNYREKKNYCFKYIDGGMRVRMFKGDNEKFNPYLTKYPLIYFQKGDIQYNSHYSFPFHKNFRSKCWGALFHYKFLPSDLKKYNEIALSGSFYNGSYEYKQYISIYNKNPNMTFIYSGSKRYVDSNSLKLISKIDQVGWGT